MNKSSALATTEHAEEGTPLQERLDFIDSIS
jgi:hypothetical protein